MTPSAKSKSSDETSAATNEDALSKKKGRKKSFAPVFPVSSSVNHSLTEIILRAGADLIRGQVDGDITAAETAKRKAGLRAAVDGRSLITSVALYGAVKLATRSRTGLGIVAGSLIAKSLYERGKAVRERRTKR